MAIPDSINEEHVRQAIARIDAEGIPSKAQSTKFDLVDPSTNKRYPPKLVLSYAAEISGFPLSRRDFAGGNQTNPRLTALGFKIVGKTESVSRDIKISDLTAGDTLSNDELIKTFAVGNSGGMRWSGRYASLVLVADHTKGLYDDRWADDVLLYTGMGRLGDQSMAGQNLRLANQADTKTPVHLFEVFDRNNYTYAGRVDLAGAVRRERQRDDNGVEREVFVFPLRMMSEAAAALPADADLKLIASERVRALRSKTLQELIDLAVRGGREVPGRRQVVATQYQRSEAVAEVVKRLAHGQCDLCRHQAPFETKIGPYLECHHVERLADGGADTIENAVALCPNCHRRMHILSSEADKKALVARIKSRLISIG